MQIHNSVINLIVSQDPTRTDSHAGARATLSIFDFQILITGSAIFGPRKEGNS